MIKTLFEILKMCKKILVIGIISQVLIWGSYILFLIFNKYIENDILSICALILMAIFQLIVVKIQWILCNKVNYDN